MIILILDDFAKRDKPGLYGTRDRRHAAGQMRGRGAGGDGYRPAAAADPRHRPLRRLQVHGRRPQGRRREDPASPDGQPGAARRKRAAQASRRPHAAAGRTVQRLPGQRAAALRGSQPRAVHDDGRAAGRRLQHAPDLLGLAVRQRLQPLRPHLAGRRPGRRQVPQPGGRRQATEGPQPAGGDGAHRRPGRRAGGERAVHPHPLQHVPRRRHQRQRGAGRKLPPGHRPDAEPGRPGTAAGDALRVDGNGLPGVAGGQYGHVDLRPGRGHGVPGAGRPVRKLVAAAGRDPGRADVPA